MSAEVIEFSPGGMTWVDEDIFEGNGAREAVIEVLGILADPFLAELWTRGFMVVPVND